MTTDARLAALRKALRAIADDDELLDANEDAFALHAARRMQAIARAALAIPAEPPTLDVELLHDVFLRLLTTDSATKDRRRRDYNQAIFNAEEGWAVFNGTDLDMVMGKFDKAIVECTRPVRPGPSLRSEMRQMLDMEENDPGSPWNSGGASS